MSNRSSWDQHFADLAWVIAERSTCPKARVGAVIFSPDHRLLGAGYNGAPSGMPHCEVVGCMEQDGRCVRAIHAETNAILDAMSKVPWLIAGASLYTTRRPCVRCANLIIQVGIQRVLYPGRTVSEFDPGLDLLKLKGIELCRI